MDWIMYQSDGFTNVPPVSDDTPIAVMMLDGEVWDDEPTSEYNWAVLDEPGEIIAYRLLLKTEQLQKRSEYA